MDNDIVDIAPKTMGKKFKAPKVKGNKTGSKKSVTWVVVGLLLLGSLGAAGYYYKQYNDVKKDPKSAQTEKNKAETARVLDKLKAAILVTESDAPTVARVEDVEKLKSSNTEFYKDVQKGDYLVIFPKRAIVFRETNTQIINIAPIVNSSDLKKADGSTPAANTSTAPAGTTPATTKKP